MSVQIRHVSERIKELRDFRYSVDPFQGTKYYEKHHRIRATSIY